ncbi:MAG: Helix-turn-helix domain [Microbacteriaceae bacterium]|jgi:excisionase family DNA binding protein|nr:Helix-turn-helix domain [Microbacteriaceae bacterium]
MTQWLSMRAAAVELSVSEQTVRRWVRSGILHGERFGPRVIRVDLDRVRHEPLGPESGIDEWVAQIVAAPH